MRCNILPAWTLLDQHLIAEKRELRMIPPLLEKRVKSGKNIRAGIPERYTLGAGHMLFWLDKMRYLSKRYDAIVDEMIRRDFRPDTSLRFDLSYAKMYGMDNDWTPQPEDYDIIVDRLKERIAARPNWYKYCGHPVSHKWVESIYVSPYLET